MDSYLIQRYFSRIGDKLYTTYGTIPNVYKGDPIESQTNLDAGVLEELLKRKEEEIADLKDLNQKYNKIISKSTSSSYVDELQKIIEKHENEIKELRKTAGNKASIDKLKKQYDAQVANLKNLNAECELEKQRLGDILRSSGDEKDKLITAQIDELEKLQAEVNILKKKGSSGRYDVLSAEHEKLKAAHEQLEAEYNEAVDESNELREEKDVLDMANKKLQKQLAESNKSNVVKEVNEQNLRNEIEKLERRLAESESTFEVRLAQNILNEVRQHLIVVDNGLKHHKQLLKNLEITLNFAHIRSYYKIVLGKEKEILKTNIVYLQSVKNRLEAQIIDLENTVKNSKPGILKQSLQKIKATVGAIWQATKNIPTSTAGRITEITNNLSTYFTRDTLMYPAKAIVNVFKRNYKLVFFGVISASSFVIIYYNLNRINDLYGNMDVFNNLYETPDAFTNSSTAMSTLDDAPYNLRMLPANIIANLGGSFVFVGHFVSSHFKYMTTQIFQGSTPRLRNNSSMLNETNLEVSKEIPLIPGSELTPSDYTTVNSYFKITDIKTLVNGLNMNIPDPDRVDIFKDAINEMLNETSDENKIKNLNKDLEYLNSDIKEKKPGELKSLAYLKKSNSKIFNVNIKLPFKNQQQNTSNLYRTWAIAWRDLTLYKTRPQLIEIFNALKENGFSIKNGKPLTKLNYDEFNAYIEENKLENVPLLQYLKP